VKKCDCGKRHPRGANYYVTVMDGGQVDVLAGPFKTHPEALALVDMAEHLTIQMDRKAWFYSYGTAAFAADYREPGKLNKHLGLPQ
jgi:hypothetical protein